MLTPKANPWQIPLVPSSSLFGSYENSPSADSPAADMSALRLSNGVVSCIFTTRRLTNASNQQFQSSSHGFPRSSFPSSLCNTANLSLLSLTQSQSMFGRFGVCCSHSTSTLHYTLHHSNDSTTPPRVEVCNTCLFGSKVTSRQGLGVDIREFRPRHALGGGDVLRSHRLTLHGGTDTDITGLLFCYDYS